jgi:aminoglycoside phosphotransferase (APT) family kinase protein
MQKIHCTHGGLLALAPHLTDGLRLGGTRGNPLELPAPDPDRLLAALSESTGRRDLAFAELPRRLGRGGEAVVDAFRLAGAPPAFAGPLVLRRLLPLKDPAQVLKEAAVHDALAGQGFPVPRVLHADAAPDALGAPYLVMEHVPGTMLLREVTRPAELAAHPTRIPRLVHQALVHVPRLTGEWQARLHGLDAGPLRRALAEAGFAPEESGFDPLLERLAERIDRHALAGLAAGLDWLRGRRPAGGPDVICHGDFVFTNLCVEAGRVTGVLDWSNATLAEPAYDVAATLARLKSNVPGLPRVLARLVRSVQARLERRYLACYRCARPIDSARIRYYEAYWLLHELVWSGERLRAGALPDDAIEHRWLQAETIDRGVADFEALTGVRLEPLRPAGA